jgi:hypothetical protein
MGLMACGANYRVEGIVRGLERGEQIVLQNNGTDDLVIKRDGSFAFTIQIADGDSYEVTVKTTPEGKYCTVSRDGKGSITGDSVLDVDVACWERWSWEGSVWLAAGQSNMEAESTLGDVEGDVSVLTFSSFKGGRYTQHEWKPISQAREFSTVAGSFALNLAAIQDAPVHIVTVAEGSTAITCWMESGNCFDRNVRQFVEQRFDGVIWWQGETEALRLFDSVPNDYKDELKSLIAQWRELFHNPNLPFFIVELQHYQDAPETNEPATWSVVRSAQYEVAQTVANVFLVPSTDITQGGYLHPENSYRDIGARLADTAALYMSQ